MNPAKAPFNQKFWGQADVEALKSGKVTYNPELLKDGKHVLGNAKPNAGQMSFKQMFSITNIKNVMKTRGGKIGVAAGVATLAAGGAIAYAASQKTGFTITPTEGYLEQLNNYERLNGGNTHAIGLS